MDKNKDCSVCNIRLEHIITRKIQLFVRIVRIIRINNLIEKEITASYQQPIIENGSSNKNNRTLLVGLIFSGKTYLMLKILSRIQN